MLTGLMGSEGGPFTDDGGLAVIWLLSFIFFWGPLAYICWKESNKASTHINKFVLIPLVIIVILGIFLQVAGRFIPDDVTATIVTRQLDSNTCYGMPTVTEINGKAQPNTVCLDISETDQRFFYLSDGTIPEGRYKVTARSSWIFEEYTKIGTGKLHKLRTMKFSDVKRVDKLS